LKTVEHKGEKLPGSSLDKAMRALLMPWRALMARTTAPAKVKIIDPHASYRKCPQCGERDLRLSDRQRAQPDVYRSRVFLLKWLCLACGYRDNETVEELE
jgi:predicted RNA-binding Zn-ribbon protein involved in translation (DUF1610 family)